LGKKDAKGASDAILEAVSGVWALAIVGQLLDVSV